MTFSTARAPTPIDRPYVSRLRLHAPLSDDDLIELEQHLARVDAYPAGKELDLTSAPPFFVTSGWACLSHSLRDGRRQIVAFLLPGDGVGFDLLTRMRPAMDVTALTALKVRHTNAAHPQLSRPLERALAGATAAQHRRLVDQVVRLGRQTAYERTAHLLLELHGRLNAVGEARPDGFHLPVKQEVLADVLGLSLVHVNRTLQQLRRDGLIEMRGVQVVLRDRAGLEAAADQSA